MQDVLYQIKTYVYLGRKLLSHLMVSLFRPQWLFL